MSASFAIMERYFHQELTELKSKLIRIGERSNEAGRVAIEGLLEADLEKVDRALGMDDDIDRLEYEIGHDAVRYVTLRAPVSSDVRLIFVAIKASHDFERAGDEAHNIAKMAKRILVRSGKLPNEVHLPRMADLALEMLREAINAFVEEDVEKARAIFKQDEEIDRLNRKNFKILATELPENEDEATVRVETIFVSKSIERIADHAKNLAEETIYLLTGE